MIKANIDLFIPLANSLKIKRNETCTTFYERNKQFLKVFDFSALQTSIQNGVAI
jgi:hypothetical protein